MIAYKCKVCGDRKFSKIPYRCSHCGIMICRQCMIGNNCIDCHMTVNKDLEVKRYYVWDNPELWLDDTRWTTDDK